MHISFLARSNGRERRSVGSRSGFLRAPEHPEALFQKLSKQLQLACGVSEKLILLLVVHVAFPFSVIDADALAAAALETGCAAYSANSPKMLNSAPSSDVNAVLSALNDVKSLVTSMEILGCGAGVAMLSSLSNRNIDF
jgi:hypothetical protein